MTLNITLDPETTELLFELCQSAGAHPEQLANLLLNQDLSDILDNAHSLKEFLSTCENHHILSN
jgi:HPt (histidine-containing phosphotransfer) domain-containing protein